MTASEAKQQGNAFFAANNFPEAVRSYSEAIRLDDKSDAVGTAIYHSNRGELRCVWCASLESVQFVRANLGGSWGECVSLSACLVQRRVI